MLNAIAKPESACRQPMLHLKQIDDPATKFQPERNLSFRSKASKQPTSHPFHLILIPLPYIIYPNQNHTTIAYLFEYSPPIPTISPSKRLLPLIFTKPVLMESKSSFAPYYKKPFFECS